MKMVSNKIVIKADELSFSYPHTDKPALNNVSFEVRKGEFIGIIGHTGAGKSTLGYCLRGLAPEIVAGELTGNIYLRGTDIKEMDLEQKAKEFGIVFQDPESQIIGSVVLEDITFGTANLGIPQAQMLSLGDSMLRDLQLFHKKYDETQTLSGGQKQRLSIGGVMLMSPSILFLDEPTTELDPIGKHDVFELIEYVRQTTDCTVMLVTHEVELLSQVADRIFVFNNGYLVRQGTPAEIFCDVDLLQSVRVREPQGAKLVRLLSELNLLDKSSLLNLSTSEIVKGIHSSFAGGNK